MWEHPRFQLPTVHPDHVRDAISVVTQSYLRAADQPFAHQRSLLDRLRGLAFHRIRGARADTALATGTERVADLLAGVHATRSMFAHAILWDGRSLSLYVGARQNVAAGIASSVAGVWRGVAEAASEPRFADHGQGAAAIINGHPAASTTRDAVQGTESRADMLLDALRDEPFAFVLVAVPLDRDSLDAAWLETRAAAELLDNALLGTDRTGATNRDAHRLRELLDARLRRFAAEEVRGLWRSATLVCAQTPGAVLAAVGALAGGHDASGLGVPLRGHFCSADPDTGYPGLVANWLSAGEVASFCHRPGRDRTGFAVRPGADFGQNARATNRGFEIGRIVDGETPTANTLSLSPAALSRHLLVVGQTGAGKSTTVRGLLSAATQRGVPFLVIEPAKQEYRRMADTVPGLATLVVGAVPEEEELLLRLNPFSVPPGFPVGTHIDLLREIFVASFGLVPPAPYLLESAIRRVYEGVGWNLGTGEHAHGRDAAVFPRLRDFVSEIDLVVREAGYDRDIERNLRAALRTRIGNLCAGSKGLSLDVRAGIPDAVLFGHPCVVELRRLGSDDEKALLMGLLFARLYEWRQVEGPVDGDRLRHLCVIEEAHRLLARRARRDAADGDMAGHAGQVFGNILAEIRAYGQGVIIADQLPSKLSDDAVKQCGTRIVHRIAPKDDRDIVGNALALTDRQKSVLAVLPVGEAVIGGEDFDLPLRVAITMAPGTRARLASSAISARLEPIRRESTAAVADAPFRALLGDSALEAAADAVWLAHSLGNAPGPAIGRLDAVAVRLVANDAVVNRRPDAAARLADLGLDEALDRRAARLGWPAAALVRGSAGAARRASIADTVRPWVTRPGPHAWCEGCPAPCISRIDAQRIAADDSFRAEAANILTESSSASDAADALAGETMSIIADLAGPEFVVHRGLLYCTAGHVLADGRRPSRVVRQFAQAVSVRGGES